MDIPEEIQVEVFRVGDYGEKGSYTESDLDAIASDYNPERHEAPVTFDHEQNGPAHGWVTGLCRIGDRLVATIARASEQLAKGLKTSAYKKRSIELYRQFKETKRPYLKAVSFLGAAAPEVKGLKDLLFTEELTVETSNFAEEARETLKAKGAWNPQWERFGVLDLYNKLSAKEDREQLTGFLSSLAAPVALGQEAVTQPVVAMEEDVASGGDPESFRLHQKALSIQQSEPTLNYREALLKVRF